VKGCDRRALAQLRKAMYYSWPADAISSRRRLSLKDRIVMKTLIVAAASLLLVACASPSSSKSDEVPVQKSYRTGSNLPVRDPSSGSSAVQGADNQDTQQMLNKPAPYVPAKGGN